MCPIVPMFTCGLVRSNFSFAIASFAPHWITNKFSTLCCYPSPRPAKAGRYKLWSGGRDLNPQPSPWKSETLPLSYPRPVVQKFVAADLKFGHYILTAETQPISGAWDRD